MNYVCHLMTLTLLYAALALGQSMLLGLGNMLFVAQAAGLGIGAYTWAIAAPQGVPAVVTFALAPALSLAIMLPVSIPALRLRGDYLLVASLALGEVVRSFLNNTPALTGGAQGLMGVAHLAVGPFQPASPADYAVLSAVLFCAFATIHTLVSQSPYGCLLRAVGEGGELMSGEDAMRALGKSVLRTRTVALALALASASMVGVFYASYMSYVDPTQFTIWDSVLVLAMTVLGGLGSVRGALAGAVIYLVVPECLRFIGLPQTTAGPLRQIIFGGLLLAVLRYRPAGLFGRKDLAWLTR